MLNTVDETARHFRTRNNEPINLVLTSALKPRNVENTTKMYTFTEHFPLKMRKLKISADR